ncbi:MAG: DUF6447 family protein [Paracoccaceae bacterium]|jgi:hypothetical protein|nr:DUF6447 family protein [Paracoccaceae bacterium]
MAEEQKNTITVDGKEYDSASLSDNSKKLIANIQFADQELARLRMQNAAMQTARQSYVLTLKNELEGKSTEVTSD